MEEVICQFCQLTASQLISIGGTLASFIGLFLSLYLLKKVSDVQKAQKEAQDVTQELLGVDQIESDYRKIIEVLNKNENTESLRLASQIGVRLGSIQGTRRVLDKNNKGKSILEKVDLLPGYFTQEFIIQEIDSCRYNLDIFTGRLLLISSWAVMEKLKEACEKDVKVRIVSLCDGSPDEILQDATKTVTFPGPVDAKEYREQIIASTKFMQKCVSNWGKKAQENFEYRTTKSVPRVSTVRTDNYVNFGFLQLYSIAQPDKTEKREYIRLSTNSVTGKAILKHFECLFQDPKGKQVIPLKKIVQSIKTTKKHTLITTKKT